MDRDQNSGLGGIEVGDAESDNVITDVTDMFFHLFDIYTCHNLVTLHENYTRRSQESAQASQFFPCPECVGIFKTENLREER